MMNLSDCKPKGVSKGAKCSESAKRLWKISEEMVGL